MNSPILRTGHGARRPFLTLLVCAAFSAAFSAPAPAATPSAPAVTAPPLKIGIIGTGRIGSALARHWARAGHELMLSSRHPETLQPLATELGPKVRVGTPQQASAFADVIFIAVPYGAMPQIGSDNAKELAGKVIIDASNPSERRDGAMGAESLRKGAGIATAGYLNNKRVVRAFDCISFMQIASDSFRKPVRRAIPIGGDDADALAVASRLVSDAGFDPAIIGSLAHTRLFDRKRSINHVIACDDPSCQEDWSVSANPSQSVSCQPLISPQSLQIGQRQ